MHYFGFFQDALTIWNNKKKTIQSRVTALLKTRRSQMKHSKTYFVPKNLTTTKEFPEIFVQHFTDGCYDKTLADNDDYSSDEESLFRGSEIDSDMYISDPEMSDVEDSELGHVHYYAHDNEVFARKTGGKRPGPIEGLGRQGFQSRTDYLLQPIIKFLDRPENNGMDLKTLLAMFLRRVSSDYSSKHYRLVHVLLCKLHLKFISMLSKPRFG